jgi:hypothetical protein
MAKSVIASRAFDHKVYGRMGVAEFLIESKSDIGFMLNGQELPPQSVDHLLTFALQTLQDAYAGAEDATDAQTRFNAKLERILAGTLGTRSGGSGIDEFTRLMRTVLRPLVKDATGAAAWKELDEDARTDAIDAAYAAQADDGKAMIAEAVERKKAEIAAEAAAKAALKGSIKISL